MRKVMTILALAGAGVALVATGCGGDDDDDTTAATTATTTAAAGEPLSKQEFIAEADTICSQGDREINQAANETFGGGQEPSQEEQEQFVTDTVLPNIQGQIDGIRALTPPEGDEDQVTAIVDAAQSGIDEVEQDPSAFTQQGGGSDPFAEANRLAQDYGLTACGGG
jgi:hypothetical protein